MKKIFLAVLVFFSFVLTSNATYVSYKGLNNVHLMVDENLAWWSAGAIDVKIKVKETGEVLLAETLSDNKHLEKKINHEGLEPGTYTYELWCKYAWEDTFSVFTIVSRPAIIDGQTIEGTLLFDETITGTASLSSNVFVPENITLTLKGTIIDPKTTPYLYITVAGNLKFEPGSSLQNDVHIRYVKHSTAVDGAEGSGWLHFNSESSGSTVSNCKNIVVDIDGEDTSIEINNSEVWLLLRDTGTEVNIEGSIIFGTPPWTGNNKMHNFTATNTSFIGDLIIEVDSPECSPKFTNCEFASPVTLRYRNSGEFTNCVFGYELIFEDHYVGGGILRWDDNSTIQPTFSGNSFVGRNGPRCFSNPPTPIDLGVNYYGDKKPNFESAPTNTFLTREIYINKNVFNVTSWNTSGPEMKNQKKLPNIWINNYVVGQNCLSHNLSIDNKVLIQGRETLLSLDVATNYTNVSGVKFKAIFGGKEIEPVNKNVVLHRDISNLGKDIFVGNTTVNFILPPTTESTVNLKVIMDTTSIQGFDSATGKKESEILNMDLEFDPLYGRNLNIAVHPIELLVGESGKEEWKYSPSGKEVKDKLKGLIPAMLPISQQDLLIWAEPATLWSSSTKLGDESILEQFSTLALLNQIANRLTIKSAFNKVTGWLTGNKQMESDFIIAVLPDGILGVGETGTSFALRREVLFVNGSTPEAALHEMGHAIGLYTLKEQYKQYKPDGLPVEGLTAFLNVASVKHIGFIGKGNRILHFPAKGQSWYEEKNWVDIMGSSSPMTWPIESTFSVFRNYFKSNLISKKTKVDSYKKAVVPDDDRRIFISAETERIRMHYEFIPETISVFDITEIATGKLPPVYSSEKTPSESFKKKLECYDNSGKSIYTIEFEVDSPEDYPSKSIFCATFDIPENTETVKIFTREVISYPWSDPIFQLNRTSTPEISIIPPASGTLSDSVDIAWTTTKQAGGTMQYVVMASPDGGNTWMPIGLPTTSTSITIPTDFLPASDNIIFKVVGSSGLGSNSAEVSNLTIENRKPKAIIVSPKDGWVGNTETKWILQGYGSDIEDGTIPTGEWTSSIDGQLNTETDIILSPGKHILTFKVTDSGELEGSSNVEVEVKETIEDIDLSLNEGCLTLITPNSDPLNKMPVIWLEKGEVHKVILKIQNVGIETNFTASLYLKGPSDTEETLLTSKVFTPEAFEEVVLSETFIVSEKGGEYTIRGEIEIPEDATLQDTNTSNNEWTWKYRTQPEEPAIGLLSDTFDFGDVKEETKGFVLIRNYGKWELVIKSLTITGKNSGEFSIDQAVLDSLNKSDIYIGSNSGIFVPVYFSPKSTGEKEATLTIESYIGNTSITLKGNCISMPLTKGDISGNGETDISDVILCLRIAIELPVTIEGIQYFSPYEPWIKERADINGDGEVDIKDVIKVLRIAIELEKMKASRK